MNTHSENNQTLNLNIRMTEPDDYRETENLAREAFWNLYQPGCEEHLILHQLRESIDFIPELDMVACEGERIIGNIVYTKATVEGDNGEHTVLCMGPLGVLPEYQKRGAGSWLMEVSSKKAQSLGYSAVVIFGDPGYYHRFGFREAGEYGIQTAEGKNLDAFMVLDLQSGGLPDISGRFHESSAFQSKKEDLEEFEKNFPPKERKVLPGQFRSEN